MSAPEQLWPGRVKQVGGSYLVDGEWAVTETGQQWDAWPWPASADPAFDDQEYMLQHLRGRGTFTAAEKIRELIGDPR